MTDKCEIAVIAEHVVHYLYQHALEQSLYGTSFTSCYLKICLEKQLIFSSSINTFPANKEQNSTIMNVNQSPNLISA